jgi:hypothetical protein
MRIRKPSPAMVVAIIALVMASTGSAVAAVNFARNAGAVDRLSAVDAGKSTQRARGKLVATGRFGENAGRIPSKFLSGIVYGDSFGAFAPVNNNVAGAPAGLATSALGSLTAACNDQAAGGALEDPRTTLTFANTSGREISLFRRVGVGDHTIVTLPNGTADSFTINNQNNFRIHAESAGTNVVFEGVVRQIAPRTPEATCIVFGTEHLVK